ncbi:MAG: hypothetical protein JJ863_31645 [Deltaproteobacteria bacterium]|nr:hypothetical protein [Deltaproteobacteria bacterium]
MSRTPRVLFLALVAACATTSTNATPTTGTPLTAEDRVLFDDGVDFVGDPSVLEGRWRDDWSRELDERVTNADIVSYIRVHALRTDMDLERRTTYRLLIDEVDGIVGDLPDDLALASLEGDGGFSTIDGNENRILDQELVLFLKWEQSEPGAEVRARWHLSPHTEDVTSRVEYLAERRRGVERPQPQRRVHVHTQD